MEVHFHITTDSTSHFSLSAAILLSSGCWHNLSGRSWLPMSAPGTPRGPKGGYVGLRRQRGGAPSPPGKMAPTSPGRRMRDEVTPRESPTEGGQMSMSPRSPGGGQKKSIQIFGCTGKYSFLDKQIACSEPWL